MLTPGQIKRLKNNWGDRADVLECNAEVRLYDLKWRQWECYLYALNPEDQDEVKCIINHKWADLTTWSMQEIENTRNAWGDQFINDLEFRPIPITKLLSTLNIEGFSD